MHLRTTMTRPAEVLQMFYRKIERGPHVNGVESPQKLGENFAETLTR